MVCHTQAPIQVLVTLFCLKFTMSASIILKPAATSAPLYRVYMYKLYMYIYTHTHIYYIYGFTSVLYIYIQAHIYMYGSLLYI